MNIMNIIFGRFFCYLAQLCTDAWLRPGDDVEQVRKRTFKQAEMAPTQPICKK